MDLCFQFGQASTRFHRIPIFVYFWVGMGQKWHSVWDLGEGRLKNKPLFTLSKLVQGTTFWDIVHTGCWSAGLPWCKWETEPSAPLVPARPPPPIFPNPGKVYAQLEDTSFFCRSSLASVKVPVCPLKMQPTLWVPVHPTIPTFH